MGIGKSLLSTVGWRRSFYHRQHAAVCQSINPTRCNRDPNRSNHIEYRLAVLLRYRPQRSSIRRLLSVVCVFRGLIQSTILYITQKMLNMLNCYWFMSQNALKAFSNKRNGSSSKIKSSANIMNTVKTAAERFKDCTAVSGIILNG